MDADLTTMTDPQREFWRALTAPFPTRAYKQREGRAGKTFTYLEPRTIMNRLDDVVGPGNWELDFVETARGIICRITIEAPDDHGDRKKVSRSGGGGFRAMQDDDSTFKTGFSSAIKTAAACFGIGRELYGEGMPAYCADLHGGEASGVPASGPGTGPPPRQTTGHPGGNGHAHGNGNGNGNGGGNGGGGFDKFKPPYGKPGKAPYAWAMKMGEHFGQDVIGRMAAYAEKRKKPKYTDKWDEAFLDECLSRTVEWLRTLDNYNGEFGASREHSPDNDGPAPQKQAPAPPAGQPHPLVSSIVAACNALLHKTTGREPTQAEIVACIGELASSVPDGQGHRGEVLQSLRNCNDATWLKNILAAANRKIQEAATLAAADTMPDDDIPF